MDSAIAITFYSFYPNLRYSMCYFSLVCSLRAISAKTLAGSVEAYRVSSPLCAAKRDAAFTSALVLCTYLSWSWDTEVTRAAS